MIRFFLLQNKQGKTRLSKWYATPPEDSERVKMEADIHRTISLRVKGHTNFIEVIDLNLVINFEIHFRSATYLIIIDSLNFPHLVP
jgi:hypothetical protein